MGAISARVSDEQAQTARLRIDRDAQAEILILKLLSWFYIINRPALALIQEAQKDVVRRLFDTYEQTARPGGRRDLLPVAEREAVAGLTELRALELHALLSGRRQGTILDPTAG